MLIMPCNNVIVHYCMENYENQGTADYFTNHGCLEVSLSKETPCSSRKV